MLVYDTDLSGKEVECLEDHRIDTSYLIEVLSGLRDAVDELRIRIKEDRDVS